MLLYSIAGNISRRLLAKHTVVASSAIFTSVVAAAAAAMVGDAVAEGENAQKTKTKIRGGKVVAFMQSDPEALSWNRQRSSTARFRPS